ncbi:hypothetical protein AC578_4017 [Pseudocercospora eumusae]|uniref:Uncharacterized protein n=1 Tax=Pseudocercospora eumusae TaxID=321146 RepID=A0A139HDY8_9PEZI|nr:hypothetical protein AC578_4017 [Pseudocercospora eumusae]
MMMYLFIGIVFAELIARLEIEKVFRRCRCGNSIESIARTMCFASTIHADLIRAGKKRGHLGVDAPCAFCQLRDHGFRGHTPSDLIYIKAKAGIGAVSDEDCKVAGYWEHAILGQLCWEMGVNSTEKQSVAVLRDTTQAAAGEKVRTNLRRDYDMKNLSVCGGRIFCVETPCH